MDFLLIVLLTLFYGVFAMSELALASSRQLRLQTWAQSGDKGAQAALQLLENPTHFLSSVQVGITSIGLLNGIVGEAVFGDRVQTWLQTWGMPVRWADWGATAVVVVGITYFTIVFGELVPKRIGQLYPETVSRAMARPMGWMARLAKPFVWLLAQSTQAVLRLLRIDTTVLRPMTEEEIVVSLEQGRQEGVIERDEHRMVQNVFLLDDRPLASLMVPRTDVMWLDARLPVHVALRLVGDNGPLGAHSWYPVCQGSLDEVLGVVSVAHLLSLPESANLQALQDHVLPAHFVPETLNGLELLEQMRKKAGRFLLVVDEYGAVQGIMTPCDLLRAITGEIETLRGASRWAVRRDDGSWLLDGQMPVAELKAQLEMTQLPDEERGRYNTLAGLLLAMAGRLLTEGEHIACAGWVFEVVDLDGRRIDKVWARPIVESERVSA